jgi:hypothetical protein
MNGYAQKCSAMMNQCNVFAAYTTDPIAGTAATVALPLTFSNILYDYGSAIQATTGTNRIFITQPGLYQVSYYITATDTAGAATVTASLIRGTTTFATDEDTIAAADGSVILSNTAIFYVACQELPLALQLSVTSTTATTSYTFFITVNRICSCNGDYNAFSGTTPNLNPFFIGCNSECSQGFDGPCHAISQGNGCNGGFTGCSNNGGQCGGNNGCNCW